MGMDSVGTEQQVSPSGNGRDVTELVLKDLHERREAGTRKYGMPLRTFNGRNALIDAYQEALDLTVYLRQRIGEQNGDEDTAEIQLTDKITVDLIQSEGGDHVVVAAAKVSICGNDAAQFAKAENAEANAGLINYLMAHRHGTPFEHAMLTFFVHAPIFVWREWHRHRIGFSYNEESARYRQLKPVFWVPPDQRKIIPSPDHSSARPKFQAGTPEQIGSLRTSLARSYQIAYSTYVALLDEGYAKEVARACLPVGIYSSCWVTCNPRSLMSFLSLRTHDPEAKFVSYPQAEIECAARAVEEVFAAGWPLTYAAFVKNGRVAP